ncbi:RNA polymerase sigma factor RpoE, partial [Vibrio parahaemolyticus]|nr:RNA polymerase sigma factor RpoE [Vibrio parahaemolyticus]
VNTAQNHLVAQGRRPPATDVVAEEAEFYETGSALKEISTPENLTLSKELHRVVFSAIEALPDDIKTAMTMRELDGLSYE